MGRLQQRLRQQRLSLPQAWERVPAPTLITRVQGSVRVVDAHLRLLGNTPFTQGLQPISHAVDDTAARLVAGGDTAAASGWRHPSAGLTGCVAGRDTQRGCAEQDVCFEMDHACFQSIFQACCQACIGTHVTQEDDLGSYVCDSQ